jgi:hypothetical protein
MSDEQTAEGEKMPLPACYAKELEYIGKGKRRIGQQ